MKTKKELSAFFALLISLVGNLYSDDGGWSNSFTINGGSIYTENEHTDIALEKELLFFDGEKTTAYFLFKNTAEKPVTVTCGFPVNIAISTYKEGNYLHIPVGKYGGRAGGITGLSYFETETYTKQDDTYGEPDFDYPDKIVINAFNNSRELLPPSLTPADIQFAIVQDGKPVRIDELVLERHAGNDGAWVTFHYKHNLSFTSDQASVVRVEYSYDLKTGVVGAIGADSYGWDYIIGTGHTWKGPIKDFYFLKPADWSGDIGGGELLFGNENIEIYHKSNYEPGQDDRFNLSGYSTPVFAAMERFDLLEENCFKNPKTLKKPVGPANSYIKNISSSSFLKETVNIFTEEGIIPGADFSASLLFDGIPETAWCEGVPGPGIGEYAAFETTRPLYGMTIQNGFNRFLVFGDEYFDSGDFAANIQNDARGIRDYHTLNNRPEILEIVTASGEVLYNLQLKDSRETQTFPFVMLSPGWYKIVVRDIYKGTKWDDTCLGEVGFMAVMDSGLNSEFLNFIRDVAVQKWLREISIFR